MKAFCILLAGFFLSYCAGAQQTKATSPTIMTDTLRNVEASCGQCKFGMKAKGCNLAIRIDGKPYFVDGTAIDDHGDAHANDGFCNKIRKADVTGAIVNGRFVATSFILQPEPAIKQ